MGREKSPFPGLDSSLLGSSPLQQQGGVIKLDIARDHLPAHSLLLSYLAKLFLLQIHPLPGLW